jgi:transcription initiation protein SPT3
LTSSAPNDDIIDILGFLTFETVAILTEQVLKVKAEFDLAQQRAPKNDISFLNWQTFTPHKHHYLFDPPEEDRSPLGAIHVREAFRRLQRPPSKSKILRNFRGGIVHTSLRLI